MDNMNNKDNQYSYYKPEGQQGGYQCYTPGDSDQDKKQKKEKHTRKKLPKALVVTGFALLFGFVSSATFLISSFLGGKAFGMDFTADTSIKSAQTNTSTINDSGTKVITSDVSGIVENVMPSIVSITNMSIQQVQDFFFGEVIEQKSESAGTGIIISQNEEELLIVTNNHVISGSDTLTVTFADNTSVAADIKGADPAHDVAVIAVPLSDIDKETQKAIAVATLGNSDTIKVGEPAIAIGNALGYGQSVTTGVISAKDRSGSAAEDGQSSESDVKLIQTDAAINHGNSGGALVNANGEVIGINSSKLVGSSVEGVGYAIPISDVSDIIMTLMNQETKVKVSENERGDLGITGFDVTEEHAESFNMPLGVYVKDVADNGGAKKAGLKHGDVITKINGVAIDSMRTLKEELKYYAVGETVNITVQSPVNDGEYEEAEYAVTLVPKGK